MRNRKIGSCVMALLVLLWVGGVYAQSGPFDGKAFKGRIAFSSDGNFNDEDDWGAFPVAVAMLDAFGVKDRLVHVDYCNILPKNDTRFYREMVTSVLGAAERYGLDRSVLYDCQKDLDGAIESITKAINASSADNPLYYVQLTHRGSESVVVSYQSPAITSVPTGQAAGLRVLFLCPTLLNSVVFLSINLPYSTLYGNVLR